MEVSYAQGGRASTASARRSRRRGLTDVSVQNFGTSRDVLIRLPLKAGAVRTPTCSKQVDGER